MPEFNDRQMHKAICSECKKECEVPFKPTEGKPVKCSECFQKSKPKRFNNKGRFGGNRRFGNRDRKMHKAICSECKKECEVPFKPTEGKPVFCNDCFSNKR